MSKRRHLPTLLIAATFAVIAADSVPEPVWAFKLCEGEGSAINNSGSGAEAAKATLLAAEKTEWGAGRLGGSSLHFKNDVTGTTRGKYSGIIVANHGAVDFSASFSVCAWILPDKTMIPGNCYQIFGDIASDQGPGFRLLYGWKALRLTSGDGKKGVAISSTVYTPFPFGTWHHVAVTYNATEKIARIYLNGALAAESQPGFVLEKSRHKHFSIACYGSGYADGWVGAVSDVKVFDQTLTHKQILVEAQNLKN